MLAVPALPANMMRPFLCSIALILITTAPTTALGAEAVPAHAHGAATCAPAKGATSTLNGLAEWIMGLDVGSNVLKNITKIPGNQPASIFINGNLARVLLAASRIAGVGTPAAQEAWRNEGLRWCDTLVSQTHAATTSKGDPAVYWGAGYPVPYPQVGEIYFGDTGTAVTALSLCYSLTTGQRAQSYLQAMERFAAFVLDGCTTAPPGRGTHGSPGWIGADGGCGCGYYQGHLSTSVYTIATGTTAAAFFTELHHAQPSGTDTRLPGAAAKAANWLAGQVGPDGVVPYTLDGTVFPNTSWPLDTLAYTTEGVTATTRRGLVPAAALMPAFSRSVQFLLRTQNDDGSWGVMASDDQMRSPRVASLLSWYVWASSTGDAAVAAGRADAACSGLQKYTAFLANAPAAYGLQANVITSGMAGLALADALQYGSTWAD